MQEKRSVYEKIAQAKSGGLVPVFAGGKPANSLYAPEKEAEKSGMHTKRETFAVFAGLADGRRIKAFLDADSKNRCIVIEKNTADIDFLSAIPEADAVRKNPRAEVLPFTDGKLQERILGAYLPALFQNFTLDVLQSWRTVCPEEAAAITEETEAALRLVSGDFSTQAAFGRLWFLNTMKNLLLLSPPDSRQTRNDAAEKNGCTSPPRIDTAKTALVVAAGPSLENEISGIKAARGTLCIFSTDTAFPVLSAAGIVPDFVVTIDPQYLSARHFSAAAFRPKNAGEKSGETPVLIADICGNPAALEWARNAGWRVIPAAGGHPLAKYLGTFFPLPEISTSAGTVTASAADAARRLGFPEVKFAGADFAYTGGKPYARGTYLEKQFFSRAERPDGAENLYTGLMFRAKTETVAEADGSLTYRTALLDSYREDILNGKASADSVKKWDARALFSTAAQISSADFFASFREALLKLSAEISSAQSESARSTKRADREEALAFAAILPLASFFRKKNPSACREKILKLSIDLALNKIEGYTGKV